VKKKLYRPRFSIVIDHYCS